MPVASSHIHHAVKSAGSPRDTFMTTSVMRHSVSRCSPLVDGAASTRYSVTVKTVGSLYIRVHNVM